VQVPKREPGISHETGRDISREADRIGSMSIWISGVCSGISEKRCVAISPSFVPRAIRQSDSLISAFAVRE
jgi:hypothetical protein